MKKYLFLTYLTIFGSIIEIILFSLPSLFVAKFVDLFIQDASLSEIRFWLLLMLSVAIIQGLIFYTIASVNEILAHRVTTDMTEDLFLALQDRPQNYHDHLQIGDVMARATGDTRIINIGISPAFRIIGQIITAFIFAVVVLFTINIELTLILILGMPIFAWSIFRYGKKLEPLSREVQSIFGEISVHTAENIAGIREIKSYSAEKIVESEFNQLSLKHAEKVRKVGISAAYYYPGLIISLLLATITLFGVNLILQGRLTLAGLVAFIGLIAHIGWISRNLQWVSEFAAKTSASSKRIRAMLNEQIDISEDGSLNFDGNDTTIEFENVSFSYSEDLPFAIKNVNFKINHGETIVIVGGPGSGKSTINKLILRLYEPTEGEIRLGNTPIRAYTNKSIRKEISIIEQNIFLFSDTIRKNIAFGKPNASLEDIESVIELAHVKDFTENFEDKLETEIGELGIRISGGQKQRLGIARALLMNPSILLMDDASSALDSETEYQIQNAIRNLIRTRTSIIVTHRLALIAEADRVLVFDKGRLIAEGSHDTLIKTSQYYRRLYENHYQLPPLIKEQQIGVDE